MIREYILTPPTKKQAILELALAGVVWGFAFICVKWSLKAFSPVMILLLRFSLAYLVGEFIYSFALKKHSHHSPSRVSLRLAFPAGFWMASFLILQTIGLKTTTSGNSGFITILYIVFVPLISQFIYKKSTNSWAYVSVLMALIGAFLMMGGKMDNVQSGDWLTLGCALISAFQIIYIDQVSEKITEPFQFNNHQSFWCFIVLFPLLLVESEPSFKSTVLREEYILALWGILGLVISSVVGFYLQVRSQKVLNPTTASLLFLLESPNAMLLGVLFLGEAVSGQQFLGALVILSAAALTIANPFKTEIS